MSWNRTVRCSYCHNTGHNIKTCPNRLKDIEAGLKSDADEWEKKRARRLQDRYDGPSRARRCSYCNDTGHNLRTCPRLSEDTLQRATMWQEARKLMADRMERHGFGIGSMLQYRHNGATHLGVVMDISWDFITDLNLRDSHEWFHKHPVQVLPVGATRPGSTIYVHLPRVVTDVPLDGGSSWLRERNSIYADVSVLASPTPDVSIPCSFLELDSIKPLAKASLKRR